MRGHCFVFCCSDRLRPVRNPRQAPRQDLPHIKEIANLLVKGITGARLVTASRAGHMANLDGRDECNRAIDTFLVSR